MNTKEIEIANKILQTISTAGSDHRSDHIHDYLTFMKSVNQRLINEKQAVENAEYVKVTKGETVFSL